MRYIKTIFFITVSFYCQSQSLNELNDAAFKAYETNKANAIELADSFYNATLDDTLSVFHINALTLLGIHSKNKGQLITSINYYLKALNAAQKTKDRGRESAILNNLGSIYQLQKNYSKSLDYFSKSLDIEENLNNPLQKSIRYFNLAEIYRNLDSLELAISNYNSSLLIEKKQNNTEGALYAKVGLAQVYLKMKRYQDVEISFDEIEPVINQCSSEININYNLLKGKYYLEIASIDKAIFHLEHAIKLAKKNQFNSLLIEGYEQVASAYEQNGNLLKSNFYLKEYIHLNKQLNDVQIKNQLEDLLHQNELDQKEFEMSVLKEEKILEKKMNSYQLKVIILIALSLILLIGLVIFRSKKRYD